MMRRLLVLFVCCLSLWSAGCASSEAPTPQTIPQLDTAHITTVKAKLQGDGELAGEKITVSGKGDTIVLEGSVQTADEKERAEKLAKSVQGVNKVENKLEVRPNTGP